MKLVQVPGLPQSVFLVPEDERDELLVEALRNYGSKAVAVHAIIPDAAIEAVLEEPVVATAFMNMIERIGARERPVPPTLFNPRDPRPCRACLREGKLGRVPICDLHLGEGIRQAAQRVVEIRMMAVCDCGSDSDAQHRSGCQAGDAKKLGAQYHELP